MLLHITLNSKPDVCTHLYFVQNVTTRLLCQMFFFFHSNHIKLVFQNEWQMTLVSSAQLLSFGIWLQTHVHLLCHKMTLKTV